MLCTTFYQPTKSAFSPKMADLSIATRAVEGLKLVYTANETLPGEDRASNSSSGSEDSDCTSTSFKPRRAFCHTCRKAQSLCICVRIKTIVENKIGITILQHPEEKDHHLGSARIAALSLRNVEVLSIPEVDSNDSFRVRVKVPGSKRSITGRVGNKGRKKLPSALPADATFDQVTTMEDDAIPEWLNLPSGTGLLFPSDKAVDLVPELCNDHACPTHLIVLDGTWSKAKRIYFENPWLHKLQHYNLLPSEPSMYGTVRREPKIGCLSTVESIVLALKMLEPDTVGLDSLLEVFDSMIEDAKGFQAQTELRYKRESLNPTP